MLRVLNHFHEVDNGDILVAAKILLTVTEERLTEKIVVVKDLLHPGSEEFSAFGDVSLDDNWLITLLQMGIKQQLGEGRLPDTRHP